MPWSLQRPLSERSEEMSLSGRQRRGAFKMCWVSADVVVGQAIIVVSTPFFPVVLTVVPLLFAVTSEIPVLDGFPIATVPAMLSRVPRRTPVTENSDTADPAELRPAISFPAEPVS